LFEIFSNYERRAELAQRHWILASLICAIVICAPFAVLLLVALPTRLEVRVVLVVVMFVASIPLMLWGVNRDRRFKE
jgi:Flp pilus assembly protein TadB